MRYQLLLLMLLLAVISYAQEMTDGIYGEVDERRCPYETVKLINTTTKICTFDKPAIPIDDIVWMSKPRLDNSNSKIMAIMLSSDGAKKLAAISKVYSGKNLIFVLNNEAICQMKVDRAITNGKIILTEDEGNPTLEYVYKKIKRRNGL